VQQPNGAGSEPARPACTDGWGGGGGRTPRWAFGQPGATALAIRRAIPPAPATAPWPSRRGA
jgi:hypothetical protein